jgi:hypothetical protein
MPNSVSRISLILETKFVRLDTWLPHCAFILRSLCKKHIKLLKRWEYNNTIRDVAMKFPERFYCKPHTCILTAYWEGSPYKWCPWAAMHLAQRNIFGTPVVEWLSVSSLFFCVCVCLRCAEIFVPLRQTLVVGTARSLSEPNQGNRAGVPFQYQFLGQKLLDR